MGSKSVAPRPSDGSSTIIGPSPCASTSRRASSRVTMTCCMAFTSAPELEGHQGAQHDGAAQNLPRGHELAEQRRAEDGCEQRLEIHDQRAAERPDAVDRNE